MADCRGIPGAVGLRGQCPRGSGLVHVRLLVAGTSILARSSRGLRLPGARCQAFVLRRLAANLHRSCIEAAYRSLERRGRCVIQPPSRQIWRAPYMQAEISDYALLGDTRTAALVSRQGSIDWLCAPRFDSPAFLAAILGGAEHGRWLLAPTAAPVASKRSYRADTLVLQTEYECSEGAVTVVDAMPIQDNGPGMTITRLVIGRGGRVPMRMEFIPRFGYGLDRPLLRQAAGDLVAACGPETLRLSTPIKVDAHYGAAHAAFTVTGRERVPFILAWLPSSGCQPPRHSAEDLIADCERWWQRWVRRCTYKGEWRPAVIRSLLTLKALIYARSEE